MVRTSTSTFKINCVVASMLVVAACGRLERPPSVSEQSQERSARSGATAPEGQVAETTVAPETGSNAALPPSSDAAATESSVLRVDPAVTSNPAVAAGAAATVDTAARRSAASVSALNSALLGAKSVGLAAVQSPAYGVPDFNTEQYAVIDNEGFVSVADRPLSTFSIDVDTASYSNVRRFLTAGAKPPAGAVRIEELINYFSYDYPQPAGAEPFSVTTELAAAPWKPEHKLVLIGLRGRALATEHVPPRNLVFLIDVSGSMMPDNKLPLVKHALAELVKQLRAEDHVAVVVYAGAGGCVLEPTSGTNRAAIEAALEHLEAGGPTNGAEGIRLAYDLARKHFDPKAINRVILATDGDFNVGTTSESELVELIEQQRASGVFLTVLGVGMGNLKDATMEKLADRGNGNYAYLDTPAEARKVLVEQASGTLVTIAKDVKIQVEFNPKRVKAYRLIGYENRRLQAKDFNDDKKDAGEIGAGHSVTALYEIVPAGAPDEAPKVDALRYQQPGVPTEAAAGSELATVKLRYKEPDADTSKLLTMAVSDTVVPIEQASVNLRFAAAVAVFGMVLEGSEDRGSASYDMAQSLARDALGRDPNAYRAEFLRLIAVARSLG